MAEGKIYVASTDGLCMLADGSTVMLKSGVTRVREGHPLLKGREGMFRELDVHYDLEDTRSAPEEKKPVPKAEEPKEKAETPREPAGLTSKDAPVAPARRGSRRTTRTD